LRRPSAPPRLKIAVWRTITPLQGGCSFRRRRSPLWWARWQGGPETGGMGHVTDIRLSNGDTTLTISRAGGGRIAGLRVGDLDVIGRGGNGLYEWGCFALAPFAGRVRRGRLTWQSVTHQLPITLGPHAIHGVTVDRPWQVLDVSATSARMSCPFDARWPWP